MSKVVHPHVGDYLNSKGTRLKVDLPLEWVEEWDAEPPGPETETGEYNLRCWIERLEIQLTKPDLPDLWRAKYQRLLELAKAKLLAHKLST